MENLAPTGIRSPNRPARSESLYQLRYPGPSSLKNYCLKPYRNANMPAPVGPLCQLTSESNGSSAIQQIPCILCSPKFHYSVHNSQPLVPVLGQINPGHTLTYYSFKIHFNTSHSFLDLPNDLFPPRFPTKTLFPFLIAPTHDKRPACQILHDNPNNIWRGVQIMNLLNVQLIPPSQYHTHLHQY